MRKFRQLIVLLIVMVVFGGSSAVPAAAQETRPTREDFIVDMRVTRGETVEVDIAPAFSGTVDSYGAESGDETVATVSVSDSTVSITGVGEGYIFVTISATNSAGTTTQSFGVYVAAPPAPRLDVQLNTRPVTVDAVDVHDVTPLFSGPITSHSVSSGDTTIVEASLDETILVLRGIAEGTTTVTLTATGPGGSTPQTFTVNVGAAEPPLLDAPTTVGTLDAAATVAVDATRQLDVAGGFSGTVTRVIPVTADAAIAAAIHDFNTTITLTGVAVGTTTIRVVAVNTGGITAQTLTVTVTGPPTITATAPSHCLTGEGTPVTIGPNTGREGIATVDIAYEVIGGAEPFTITNDANNIAVTNPTGTISVPCTRPGIDIHNVAPDANAVESGPKTITLTITDNNNETATTQITTQVVEDAATTTENNGGGLQAGKTYVIGDPDEWTLITLPAGLSLNFIGHDIINNRVDSVHFTHPQTGSILALDWTTGDEVFRKLLTPASNSSNYADSRQTNSLDTLFSLVSRSAHRPVGIGNPGSRTSYEKWRPYPDLPAGTIVALQPRLMIGEPLKVCNGAMLEDFSDPFPAIQGHSPTQLLEAYDTAFENAVDLWNKALHGATMQRASPVGTPSLVFELLDDCAGDVENPVGSSADIIVLKKLGRDLKAAGSDTDGCPLHGTPVPTDCDDRYEDVQGRACPGGREDGGCAFLRVYGERPPTLISHYKHSSPPKRYGSYAIVAVSDERFYLDSDGNDLEILGVFERYIAHELGHYLGLGDYGLITTDGTLADCPGQMRTLYAYRSRSEPDCASRDSELITRRDREDVHAIYHPDALLSPTVVQDGEIETSGFPPIVVDGGWEIHGELPRDTGRQEMRLGGGYDTVYDREYNAFGFVVWSRELALGGSWNLLGSVPLSVVATVDGQVQINFVRDLARGASFSPVGWEFRVAGVTRGI